MTNLAIHTPRTSRGDARLRRYGPWAVVTGASDGIGRAFAHELARGGFHLVVCARRGDALAALCEELGRAYGIEARACVADLSARAGVERLVDATRGLDAGLLVAAAGHGTSGSFLDADLSAELGMIDLNCAAVTSLSHAFGQRFARRGRGGLVLLSSLVAFQGVPGAANYAATKAYVQSFAEALALELSPLGVDVVASAPGPVHSGFAERANMRMSFAQSPESVARGTLSALGTWGTVRPGFLARALELSLSLLPRWGRIRMMGVVMRGMTRHHG